MTSVGAGLRGMKKRWYSQGPTYTTTTGLWNFLKMGIRVGQKPPDCKYEQSKVRTVTAGTREGTEQERLGALEPQSPQHSSPQGSNAQNAKAQPRSPVLEPGLLLLSTGKTV